MIKNINENIKFNHYADGLFEACNLSESLLDSKIEQFNDNDFEYALRSEIIEEIENIFTKRELNYLLFCLIAS